MMIKMVWMTQYEQHVSCTESHTSLLQSDEWQAASALTVVTIVQIDLGEFVNN